MSLVASLVVVGCALLLVAWFAVLVRRHRKKHDSVGGYAAASTALKHIASQPRPEVPFRESEPATPSVHVIPDVAALRLVGTRISRTPAARRAPRRPDAAALERRPTVATLPIARGQATLGADERLATLPSNAETRMPNGSVPQ